MENNKGLLKPTLIITFCSLLGIFISFFLQLIVAYYFGTTFERDAYFLAIVVPTYLSAVFIGSMGVIFLPLYVDINSKRSEKDANAFLNNVIGFSILVCLVIVIICVFEANRIISIIAPGFSDNQISICSKFFIILMPSLIFQVITNIFSSILQIQKKFFIPAISPVISSLISLSIVFLFANIIGITSLAIATLLGTIISFLITYKALCRNTQIVPTLKFNDRDLIRLLKITFPLVLAALLARASDIIERTIASNMSEGSISYLAIAKQIMVILATIISGGIATSIFPSISKAWSENNFVLLGNQLNKSIRIVLLAAFPITAIFIILGEPIIQIVFERGAFTHDATINVYKALSILMGAFFFSCLGSILAKVIYSSQKTWQGLFIAFMECLIYLIVGIVSVKHLSFLGLAIALTISSMVSVLFCLIILIILRILTKKNLKKMLVDGLLIFSFTCIYSFILFLVYSYLSNYISGFFALFLTIGISSVILFFLYYLKYNEVRTLVTLIFDKFKKKKNLEKFSDIFSHNSDL